ncbi:MAG: metal-dependent transcriptional regulator [Wujia sp.]
MKIQESAEDYLEAILYLSQRNEYVRSIDVAHHLGFSKPSVSVYLKNLRVNGYINIDTNGHITLLDKGMEIAQKIYERHNILANFFMTLGVSREVAFEDACRVEHDLSDETYSCLKNHYMNQRNNQEK